MASADLRSTQTRPATAPVGPPSPPAATTRVAQDRDRARPRDRRHGGKQVERSPGRREQRQCRRVDAHNQPPSRVHYVVNAPSCRIAAVGEDMVAGPDWELRQRFSRAGTLRPRQLEEVAGQRRQAHAVVQAPQRPARSRFLHCRRIHRPDLERAPGDDREVLLLEQTDTQRVQPRLGFLQALQQRHVRQVRQMRLAGANHGFPQRVPATEVQQEGPQEVVDALVLAKSLQRPGVLRQLPPISGEERQLHVPVLVHCAGPRVTHPHDRIRRLHCEIKLAPMDLYPRRHHFPQSNQQLVLIAPLIALECRRRHRLPQ